MGIDEYFEGFGLDRSKNNWKDVDDFNWLFWDEVFLNWSIFFEGECMV